MSEKELLRRENQRLRAEVDELRERVIALESVRVAPREQSRHRWYRHPAFIGGAVITALLSTVVYQAYEEAERASRRAFTARTNARNALNQVGHVQARMHRVEQRLAHQSVASQGPSFDPVEREGEVSEVTGEAPVEVGDACRVKVTAAARVGLTCRAEVRCGGELLYGRPGYGYLRCDLAGGRPATAVDHDGSENGGDPKIDLDLPGDRIVVSDGPDPTMSVTIALR